MYGLLSSTSGQAGLKAVRIVYDRGFHSLYNRFSRFWRSKIMNQVPHKYESWSTWVSFWFSSSLWIPRYLGWEYQVFSLKLVLTMSWNYLKLIYSHDSKSWSFKIPKCLLLVWMLNQKRWWHLRWCCGCSTVHEFLVAALLVTFYRLQADSTGGWIHGVLSWLSRM